MNNAKEDKCHACGQILPKKVLTLGDVLNEKELKLLRREIERYVKIPPSSYFNFLAKNKFKSYPQILPRIPLKRCMEILYFTKHNDIKKKINRVIRKEKIDIFLP